MKLDRTVEYPVPAEAPAEVPRAADTGHDLNKALSDITSSQPKPLPGKQEAEGRDRDKRRHDELGEPSSGSLLPEVQRPRLNEPGDELDKTVEYPRPDDMEKNH